MYLKALRKHDNRRIINKYKNFDSAQMEIDYIRVFAVDADRGDQPIWSDEFD